MLIKSVDYKNLFIVGMNESDYDEIMTNDLITKMEKIVILMTEVKSYDKKWFINFLIIAWSVNKLTTVEIYTLRSLYQDEVHKYFKHGSNIIQKVKLDDSSAMYHYHNDVYDTLALISVAGFVDYELFFTMNDKKRDIITQIHAPARERVIETKSPFNNMASSIPKKIMPSKETIDGVKEMLDKENTNKDTLWEKCKEGPLTADDIEKLIDGGFDDEGGIMYTR